MIEEQASHNRRFTFIKMIVFKSRNRLFGSTPALIYSVFASTLLLSCSFVAFAADPVSVSMELNKLETKDKSCRAYIVIENSNANSYTAFKLDLVLFQPDGIIGRRIAIDLAPLRPVKKSVKLFDLEGTPCNMIGGFLVNEVVECKSETDRIEDCLSGLKVNSLSQVQLTK